LDPYAIRIEHKFINMNQLNRLHLTLVYPKSRLWADYFIYFYDHNIKNARGLNPVVCVLDIRTDEIVEDYRNKEK
jgi:hypothetical protein